MLCVRAGLDLIAGCSSISGINPSVPLVNSCEAVRLSPWSQRNARAALKAMSDLEDVTQ